MANLYPGLKVKKTRGQGNIGKTAVVVSTLPPNNEIAIMLGLTLTVRWLEPWTVFNVLTGETSERPAGTESLDDPECFDPILPDGVDEWAFLEELEEPECVA